MSRFCGGAVAEPIAAASATICIGAFATAADRRKWRTDRVELSELVVLGAQIKLQKLRAARARETECRRMLGDPIRQRRVGAELGATEGVRSSGWARLQAPSC